jgi:hypothetical protein
MTYIPKEKKTSIVLALINLILGAAVLVFFMIYIYVRSTGVSSLAWVDFQKFLSSFAKSLNFKSIKTYGEILVVIGPFLFALLALIFSRVGRWSSILCFSSFLATSLAFVAYSYYHNGGLSKIFDFSSFGPIFLSCALIAGGLGIILSFINLEKSK